MNDYDLGLCCACDSAENVRNIITLDRRLDDDMCGDNLGWGCMICGLPFDGAVAALCDGCLESDREIRYIRLGGIMGGLRADSFPCVPFRHDLSRHPELWPISNPDASIMWFDDSPNAGPDCLCSYCGQPIHDIPLRIFDDNGEARFHEICLSIVRSENVTS